MVNLLKRSIVIVLLLAIVGGVATYIYLKGRNTIIREFTTVERRDVIQEIDVVGRVKPSASVNLAFEKSGMVSRVYADIGSKVGVGQALVTLGNSELLASRRQAEADMKTERAKLDEIKRATREEDIDVQKTKVGSYETALEDAKKNLVDKLQDSYTKSDDAVTNKVDQLFSNPRSSNPQLSFLIAVNSVLKSDIEWRRFLLQGVFTSWRLSLDALTTSNNLSIYMSEAEANLNQTKSLLDSVAPVVNSVTSSANLSQSTVDAWKTDVSTGRTNVNTAITNLTAANEKLKAAESNLALSKQELILKEAGALPEQIRAQEAKIESAVARVDNLQAQLSKTIMRAPMSGIVTMQDAKVGEIISANSILVSIISDGWVIEANMPEADIAKVQKGNSAVVTLDAYGRDVEFMADVVVIDPAETVIDGVSTYKVTLQFIKKYERIKSGMTAKINISTGKRENVIAVPQRSVIRKDGNKFVRILNGASVEEIMIETGLRGSDGNVEVTSGVNEGDKIITFSEE